MKASTSELRALLASGQVFIADLFTIALLNGEVLTLTSADFTVHYLGNDYLHNMLMIERGDITSAVGVTVDEIDLTLSLRPDDSLFGMPVPAFVHNGGFDGARVLIQRAFMADPGVPVGVVHLFEGVMAEPSPSRTQITLKVSSDLILLNVMVPKNTIKPGCSNVLFDEICGLNRTLYTHAGTVQTGSSRNSIVTDLPQADGYYSLGSMTFSTGNNAGAKRTIKWHHSGVITPAYPFYYPPTIGDSFTATAGCDRTRPTCDTKFDNLANIRIFPFVPTPTASA